MKQTLIQCPRCSGAAFAATIVGGEGTDTRSYLQLSCQRCFTQREPQLHFVVDLTPDFEREASLTELASVDSSVS